MNIKKIYFWLVSLISVVVLSISFWVALTALWKIYFISDKEYLAVHDYELNNCDYKVKSALCWPDYKTGCNYNKKDYQDLLN